MWQFNIGKPIFSSPASFYGGYVVASVDTYIYAFSHSGQKLWQYATSAPVFSTPRICHCPPSSSTDHWSSTGHSSDDLVVVVGSHDHRLHCLSVISGSLRWCRELDSELYSSPTVFRRSCHSAGNLTSTADAAAICSRRGSLYLIDLRNRKARLLHQLAGEIFSSPVVSSGTAHLERRSGDMFSPVVCDAHLVVGCRDNYVYCFHLVDEADCLGD